MMVDYKSFKTLLRAHRYEDAAAEARRLQATYPHDIGPTQCLAEALFAAGDYAEALPVYERVDVHERSDLVDTGRPGRRIDMSCCHWMMGDRAKAIELMREMVDGILDRSIEFGDAAGGVQQGLLLHYMGVTANDKSAVSKARSYLRSRAKRSAIELFPG